MKPKDRVNEIYNDLLNVRNNILDCKPAKSLSCNYCDIKATIKKIVENNHDSIFTPAFNYYLIYNSFRRGDIEFRVELNRSLYHLINYYSMMVELGNFFDVITHRRSSALKYFKVYEENLDQKYDDLFLQGICRVITYLSGRKRIEHSPENLARYIERKMDEKIKEIK